MSKRTKLVLVILIALLILLLGLYLLLSPFLKQAVPQDTGAEYNTTPQSQPTTKKPTTQNVSGLPVMGTSTQANHVPTQAEILRNLENRARGAVERVGSGSSQTGFLGYSDAMLDSTEGFKAELAKLQQDMRNQHPTTGQTYGVSTRGASSHITDGKPGDDRLIAEVQAVQTFDAGNPRQPTGSAGKKIIVTFAKQADGSYLIDGMAWSDLAL